MSGVTFRFEGQSITASEASSIGAALWAAGVRQLRSSRVLGRPRGIYCGIGQCYDCVVHVNDGPLVRACITTVTDGDVVTSG
jgi:aerobic-type carbon monoxide dehydrogenase small subunit (CoxS/CutS family)